jgi:hypothetical protein
MISYPLEGVKLFRLFENERKSQGEKEVQGLLTESKKTNEKN